MLLCYFDSIFVHQRQKVRLRPEIFVNFRPEPYPKSPARLTNLPQTPISDPFELHYFTQRVSQFKRFDFFTFGLRLLLKQNPG